MSFMSSTEQPQLVSLLSSTSRPALSPLWSTHLPSTPASSSSASHVSVLSDAALRPRKSFDDTKAYIPKHSVKGSLAHQIVHIQSPDPRSTYIQAGCSVSELRRSREKGKQRQDMPLGLGSAWLHLQLRPLGQRPLCIEVGVVDERGREGVIRVSSFKSTPTIHPHRDPPLAHFPLQMPKQNESTLTPWVDISLDLATLLRLSQQLPRPQLDADDQESELSTRSTRRKFFDLPGGKLRSVSYVRLYANMRVRRVYLTRDGEKTMQQLGQSVRDEWALYATSSEG